MRRFLKTGAYLISSIVMFIICLNIYAIFSKKLPIKSANSFYLYDKDNKLINSGNNKWIKLKDISKYVIEATIASEDKNFYDHKGFDYLRIIKAFLNNIGNSNIQGASTITQQLSKNLFLSFDKTWERKIEEALITIRLENHYTKDEILEGYLNTINYGGVFGIGNASKYYFNKSSSELTLEEAAILVGIPKSPNNYSPIYNYENSKKRQKTILSLMVKNKYITKKEMDKAYKKKLNIVKSKTNKSNLISYFEDAVFNELYNINDIPKSLIDTKGLKIYTTLDNKAIDILRDNIDKYLSDSNIEISAILMNPNSGEIKAIAGGKDYNKSEYNRVLYSKRQIGSTIKPFLYYAALENNLTPSTTFTSEKTTFNINGAKYSPKNYNDIYKNGLISMSAAIAYSDNIYALKTHLFLGTDTLSKVSKKLGLNIKENASSALGTDEENILKMTEAYSVLANEGYKIKGHFIRKVLDINDNILYKYKNEKTSVLKKEYLYILNELLTSSYDKNLLSYNTPTCLSIAPKITKKYAIKTGTTDTDHLMFGYNNKTILGIWMGYDNNKKTDVSVGNIMKNIWVDTMESYIDKNTWYDKPNDIVGVIVNPITGKLATKQDNNIKLLYYIKGTEPKK